MIVRALQCINSRLAMDEFCRTFTAAWRTAILASLFATPATFANGLTIDTPPLDFLGASQFGSQYHDYNFSLVLADDGSLYSGGGALGSIAGPNANGFSDILLTRLHSNGNVEWHRQVSANDSGPDIDSVDE